MKIVSNTLVCAALALMAAGAAAQGAIGNGVPQPKSKPPTVDECKDRMAKAGDTPKTKADKRMDKTCARVLKKAEAKK
jgi:hypothetical protein